MNIKKLKSDVSKRAVPALTRDLFNIDDEKRAERAQKALDSHTTQYNIYVEANEPKAWLKNEIKKHEAQEASDKKRAEVEAELTI